MSLTSRLLLGFALIAGIGFWLMMDQVLQRVERQYLEAEEEPMVDIANARLTFEGGAVANLTASRISLEKMRKLRIFQSSGYLSLNLADGSGEFLRLRREIPSLAALQAMAVPPAGGLADIVERIPLKGNGAEPLRKELESFRDAASGSGKPAVSGDEGRAALALTLSIEERIRSHVALSRPA